MYCQYCGGKIDDGARRCAACGRLVPVSGRGPWPALFLVTLLAFVALGIWHLQGGGAEEVPGTAGESVEQAALLPARYELPARFGDLGPRLIAAGAIDEEKFVQTYEAAGQPLTAAQLDVLRQGSEESIVVDGENAYFLLNFFWAVGLANENPLLTEGPLMEAAGGDVGRFASVGGWTIGHKAPRDLYASAALIPLTTEQQARVEEVAYGVYRPCCNNHTAFADCNHGMAMLGLLELMAAQGATVQEMFQAAKYVNAFWYPQQAQETAIFFQKTMNLAYEEVEPRMAVGREAFSGAGFQQVHEWLVANEALPQPSGGGNSCGV